MQTVKVNTGPEHANRTSAVVPCALNFANDLLVMPADWIAEETHATTDELLKL